MNQVRFGVIGCGAIHGTHCSALQTIQGAELAAVYDVERDRAIVAGERYACAVAGSLEDLLEQVDAVSICIPSGLHAQIGIQAAKAGKHVLSEKPIDVSVDRATQFIDACRAARVKLGVISQHRFAPEVQRARELVQSGALGDILQCDIYNKWYRTQAYYDSGEWRGTNDLDGGCLMNQAIHYIDLGQWIMGGISGVQGMIRTVAREIEAETTAFAILEFQNGAIGSLQATSICYPGFAERIEIHGTDGTLILETDFIKFFEADPESAQAGKYGRGLNARPAGIAPAEPSQKVDLWEHNHRAQIEDFTKAVLDDRDPFITGEQAIQPLKVIRAIYESSNRGGSKVEVKETMAQPA